MPKAPKTHRQLNRYPRPRDTRPNAHQRGYTRRWREYARGFLIRNPVCVDCGRKAEHVDHIRAVTGPDDAGFWEEDNHQALCRRCHSRKTVREDGAFGRPKKRGDQDGNG